MRELRDPRFLIVDDVPARRRVMCALLKEIGFERTASAEDGGVALAMLGRATYDVVVSDTLMPNMNGFELLAAIKADAALKHLPVLMVTVEGRDDDFARADGSGCCGLHRQAVHPRRARGARARGARAPGRDRLTVLAALRRAPSGAGVTGALSARRPASPHRRRIGRRSPC